MTTSCRPDAAAAVDLAALQALPHDEDGPVFRAPWEAQAFAMARAGWLWSVESGPATTPWAPISASHSRPSSSAFDFFITTTAHAPSEICDAEPAVMVPSLLNAGRSRLKRQIRPRARRS